MANWSKSVLTHEGIKLINSTISGGNIEITSVKSGSGSVPVVDLRDQTELQSVKQTLQISKITNIDGITTISAILSNIGLSENYGLQQIGIYAADGENEILFAISQSDNPTSMPTESEMPLYSISFNLSFIISNDLSMTVVIDSESLVTIEQLNEVRINLENELNSVDNQVDRLIYSLGEFSGSRNIISTEGMFVSYGTGTITQNSDGSVTVTNNTSSKIIVKTVFSKLDFLTYTFSVTSPNTNFRWYVGKGDTLFGYVTNSGSYTFTNNSSLIMYGIGIEVPANSTKTFYLMGNVGDKAIPFEKIGTNAYQEFNLICEITNSLDARVTALENVTAFSNVIFDTGTYCADWTKIEFTKTINVGSVLLFCLHENEGNIHYEAVVMYYAENTDTFQYVTPTKSIHIEWHTGAYCNVKLDGFTYGGVYRIIQLLK